MLRNLFVGNTSQLAYFWQKNNADTDFISSRNLGKNINWLQLNCYNNVIISYADGRTYLENQELSPDFIETNVLYTEIFIKNIIKYCNNIIYFSTTELFNKHDGPLMLPDNNKDIIKYFNFDTVSPYINSKAIITKKLLNFESVIVVFPFQFNSPVRLDRNYLFSKVFNSIINKEHIIVGDTYVYRELLHPRFIERQTKEVLKTKKHQIIGSGRVVFVNDFIRDVFKHFHMNYNEYVEENLKQNLKVKRNVFYYNSKRCLYSYEELLSDTVNDLENIIKLQSK